MRQSQKTENKADYLRRVTLEGSEQTGARSVVSGEKRTQNGLLREKVLDRNNLNRAFVHVKRNKGAGGIDGMSVEDRKSTRLNSSHVSISYAVFCLKNKNTREHAKLS